MTEPFSHRRELFDHYRKHGAPKKPFTIQHYNLDGDLVSLTTEITDEHMMDTSFMIANILDGVPAEGVSHE